MAVSSHGVVATQHAQKVPPCQAPACKQPRTRHVHHRARTWRIISRISAAWHAIAVVSGPRPSSATRRSMRPKARVAIAYSWLPVSVISAFVAWLRVGEWQLGGGWDEDVGGARG